MTTPATSTPWMRKGEKLYGHDDRVTACCCQGFRTFAEGEANAKLILTAVNSHAALLAALRRALNQWRMYAEMHQEEDLKTSDHEEGVLYRECMAALTQAEVPDGT